MEYKQNKKVIANRCAIVCGAPLEDIGWFYKQISGYDYIVAADSGYDHLLSVDIKPDILIGDLDSISEVPIDVEVIRYPARKDDTDFSICLKYCLDNKIYNIDVFAAWGNRIDHSIGALFSMLEFHKRGMSIRLITPKAIMFYVSEYCRIPKNDGYVSLFAIGEDACGVTLKGFDYTLNNQTLYNSSPLGVSNIISSDYGEIFLKSGNILVVIQNK